MKWRSLYGVKSGTAVAAFLLTVFLFSGVRAQLNEAGRGGAQLPTNESVSPLRTENSPTEAQTANCLCDDNWFTPANLIGIVALLANLAVSGVGGLAWLRSRQTVGRSDRAILDLSLASEEHFSPIKEALKKLDVIIGEFERAAVITNATNRRSLIKKLQKDDFSTARAEFFSYLKAASRDPRISIGNWEDDFSNLVDRILFLLNIFLSATASPQDLQIASKEIRESFEICSKSVYEKIEHAREAILSE
jgi:hypothetical protein